MPERAYFDTSALIKRYTHEEGSAQVRALLRRHKVVSSAIAPVEACSALLRRRTEGRLSERDFSIVVNRMRSDSGRWDLVELNKPVLDRAEDVIEAAGVKRLDGIHIAAALIFQEHFGVRLRFVTADARQSEGARRMALKVTSIYTD